MFNEQEFLALLCWDEGPVEFWKISCEPSKLGKLDAIKMNWIYETCSCLFEQFLRLHINITNQFYILINYECVPVMAK